jgi:hypothetical protein
MSNAARRGFPLAGPAACAAQRVPPGAHPKSTSSVRLCLSSGRNFGFLHPNCKRLIALLHVLLKFAPGWSMAWVKARAPMLCACCGAVMAIVKTRLRSVQSGGSLEPIVAVQGL